MLFAITSYTFNHIVLPVLNIFSGFTLVFRSELAEIAKKYEMWHFFYFGPMVYISAYAGVHSWTPPFMEKTLISVTLNICHAKTIGGTVTKICSYLKHIVKNCVLIFWVSTVNNNAVIEVKLPQFYRLHRRYLMRKLKK